MAKRPRWGDGNLKTLLTNSDDKYSRLKVVVKSGLRKFGPLLLTGLVAAVEHHLHERDDERKEEDKTRAGDLADEKYDKSSIREVRHQSAKPKRTFQRRAKHGWEGEETSSSAGSSTRSSPQRPETSPIAERSSKYQQKRPREPYFEEAFVDRQPRSYLPKYKNSSISPGKKALHERSGQSTAQWHPRRRNSSVANWRSCENEFSKETIQAGKVAALAGFVEAIHVGGLSGESLGTKGMRVGTTMAASFGANYSRDRNSGELRTSELLADVGTGLLVTRLVHGSSRRTEQDQRISRKERRWSY